MEPTTIYLVVSAIAAAYAARQQQKASIAARKASKVQNRVAKAQALRQRQKELAQGRIQRAQLLARSQFVGGQAGSAEAGASSALTSQLSGELTFAQGVSQMQDRVFAQNQRATGYQEQAAVGGAVSQVSGSFAGR